MYITYSEYTDLYDPIDGKLFNRLAFDACRYLDRLTAGADGVKKLSAYFPTDADSVVAVKHCAAKVVNILFQIHEAEASASGGRGYENTEHGSHGKVVSSVSAGNESVSYSIGGAQSTAIDAAVSNPTARDTLICNTIRQYLSGVQDANGVNLLYMGVYPCV